MTDEEPTGRETPGAAKSTASSVTGRLEGEQTFSTERGKHELKLASDEHKRSWSDSRPSTT